MKLVKIEELDVGDEIIISCQGYFKYLKILSTPKLKSGTNCITGDPLYKSVKCSTVRETTQMGRKISKFNGNIKYYDVNKWGWGPDNHNFTQYIRLDYRQIILVKKNNE